MGTPGDKRRFLCAREIDSSNQSNCCSTEATFGSALIAGAHFAHGCRA